MDLWPRLQKNIAIKINPEKPPKDRPWMWTGKLIKFTPIIWYKGKATPAARVLYEHLIGPPPRRLVRLGHRLDINPWHYADPADRAPHRGEDDYFPPPARDRDRDRDRSLAPSDPDFIPEPWRDWAEENGVTMEALRDVVNSVSPRFIENLYEELSNFPVELIYRALKSENFIEIMEIASPDDLPSRDGLLRDPNEPAEEYDSL